MSASWRSRGCITCGPPPAAEPPAAARAPAPAPRARGADEDAAAPASPAGETTPLVVNGVMYIASPYGRVVALDPTTGKEMWVYQVPSGNPSTRGVEYWPGDAKTPPQIVFGTGNGRLFSLDAKTGSQTRRSATRQRQSEHAGDSAGPAGQATGSARRRPCIKHLIITGGRTQENPPRGPAGDVRAWDIHTGKLVWTFHSVPRAGEKFNDTWAGDSWKNRSGVNVWGFITVDVQRGIVYMPFGAPSVDQFGGDRAGDNLFSSSIVAADANTGKYLWHFQVDPPRHLGCGSRQAAGALDVRQGGKTIPAVAVISKSGCSSCSIA